MKKIIPTIFLTTGLGYYAIVNSE